MIYIKSEREIKKIRRAAEIYKIVKDALITKAQINTSLKTLDLYAKSIIEQNEATCTFYQYKGFPGNICICVNEQIIHGIATDYVLKKNDLVTFDIGITYQSAISDAAFSIVLGDDFAANQINDVCYKATLIGINEIKHNVQVGNISNAIETYVKSKNYFLLRDFGGHGCGIKLHEDPIILNYGKKNTGPYLKKNMVVCIEPMIMTDSNEYYIAKDQWTVIAKNKKLACHWEHMVLVTDHGFEILTA